MSSVETVDAAFAGVRVVLSCDSSAVAEAKTFMTLLSDRRTPLVDGAIIPLGFSHLVLREEHGVLVAHEPNYAGNPVIALRRDCTTTLAVHREMLAFANARGVRPAFPRFADTLNVRLGWAAATALDLQRDERGWTVDFAGATTAFGALRVYELLAARPTLLRLLALPVGCRVSVDGERVTQTKLAK